MSFVFIILQIFFATRAVLKIGVYSGHPPVLAGDIRSRDVFRPIARERKDLMDYNLGYPPVLAGDIRSRDVFRPIARERKDLMDYNYNYFTGFVTIFLWSLLSLCFSSTDIQHMLIYLGRCTSETCFVSSAGRPSSPRDFTVIENDKRMSSVCNQDSLECVSLEEKHAKKFKLSFCMVFQ